MILRKTALLSSLILVLACGASTSHGRYGGGGTYMSVADGQWHGSIWNSPGYPGATNSVVIMHDVSIDAGMPAEALGIQLNNGSLSINDLLTTGSLFALSPAGVVNLNDGSGLISSGDIMIKNATAAGEFTVAPSTYGSFASLSGSAIDPITFNLELDALSMFELSQVSVAYGSAFNVSGDGACVAKFEAALDPFEAFDVNLIGDCTVECNVNAASGEFGTSANFGLAPGAANPEIIVDSPYAGAQVTMRILEPIDLGTNPGTTLGVGAVGDNTLKIVSGVSGSGDLNVGQGNVYIYDLNTTGDLFVNDGAALCTEGPCSASNVTNNGELLVRTLEDSLAEVEGLEFNGLNNTLWGWIDIEAADTNDQIDITSQTLFVNAGDLTASGLGIVNLNLPEIQNNDGDISANAVQFNINSTAVDGDLDISGGNVSAENGAKFKIFAPDDILDVEGISFSVDSSEIETQSREWREYMADKAIDDSLWRTHADTKAAIDTGNVTLIDGPGLPIPAYHVYATDRIEFSGVNTFDGPASGQVILGARILDLTGATVNFNGPTITIENPGEELNVIGGSLNALGCDIYCTGSSVDITDMALMLDNFSKLQIRAVPGLDPPGDHAIDITDLLAVINSNSEARIEAPGGTCHTYNLECDLDEGGRLFVECKTFNSDNGALTANRGCEVRCTAGDGGIDLNNTTFELGAAGTSEQDILSVLSDGQLEYTGGGLTGYYSSIDFRAASIAMINLSLGCSENSTLDLEVDGGQEITANGCDIGVIDSQLNMVGGKVRFVGSTIVDAINSTLNTNDADIESEKLTISGSDAEWTDTGNVIVGRDVLNHAATQVYIIDGATATVGDGDLGLDLAFYAHTGADHFIRDLNSLLHVKGDLTLASGATSEANLDIANGGEVFVEGRIWSARGWLSQAAISVREASTLGCTDQMEIAMFGNVTVDASEGSQINTNTCAAGIGEGSEGNLNLTDEHTLFHSTGGTTFGVYGKGVGTVSGGADMLVDGILAMALHETGQGALDITGPSTVTANKVIGGAGVWRITLINDGRLDTTEVWMTDKGRLGGDGTVAGDVKMQYSGLLFADDHLEIDGDLISGGASRLEFNVAGSAAGQYDTVGVTGAAAVGGTAFIDVEPGTLQVGDTLDVLTAATINADGLSVTDTGYALDYDVIDGVDGQILRITVVEPVRIEPPADHEITSWDDPINWREVVGSPGPDDIVSLGGLANGFVTGDEIHFSSTDTTVRGLMAHEAVHIVQQTGKVTAEIGATFYPGSTLTGSGALGGDVVMCDDSCTAPGQSPGQLDIQGDWFQLTGALLALEIGGTVPISEYDRLLVADTATLDEGSLINVVLIDLVDPVGNSNPFEPQAGNFFDVLVAHNIIDFGVVLDLPELDELTWDVSLVDTPGGNQALRLTATPEPATMTLLALGGLAVVRRRRKR